MMDEVVKRRECVNDGCSKMNGQSLTRMMVAL